MWLLLAACSGPEAVGPADTQDPSVALPELPADALLTRASIDLRGVRPTLAEYAALASAADANVALSEVVAQWLVDPRFGDQVGALYADTLLTRQDGFLTTAAAYDLEPPDPAFDPEGALAQAVGDVPIRMVARIAAEDLSWTEAVTGDWTYADETLAAIWPVDYPADATGWQLVHWTDGRPPVGLLATNSMWWRYTTTESNASRGRANALSRIFLCNDYLSHPIPFDIELSLIDEDAVRAAITTEPGCVSCHVSLDPLAGYFFGFYYRFDENPYERAVYHPERAARAEEDLGVAPGYFGVPGGTLYDLGQHVAADDRFVTCAVRTVYGGLLQRALGTADDDAVVLHREAFLAGGLTLRALYASILADPVWRAAPPIGDTTPGGRLKLVSPEQLGSIVEDLTGYRMRQAGWDLLRTDLYGVRLLAGGIDGVNATAALDIPTPTLLLVQQRLAEAAAITVTTSDFLLPQAKRRLYTRVELTDAPEAARSDFTTQIQDLALRVIGERWPEDGADVAGLIEVWTVVAEESGGVVDGVDAQAAWAAVLTALMRDPAFGVY